MRTNVFGFFVLLLAVFLSTSNVFAQEVKPDSPLIIEKETYEQDSDLMFQYKEFTSFKETDLYQELHSLETMRLILSNKELYKPIFVIAPELDLLDGTKGPPVDLACYFVCTAGGIDPLLCLQLCVQN